MVVDTVYWRVVDTVYGVVWYGTHCGVVWCGVAYPVPAPTERV